MTYPAPRRIRVSRDTIVFITGLGGFLYEIVKSGAERPTLLLICAAMMGLPAFWNADEKHQPVPPQPDETGSA